MDFQLVYVDCSNAAEAQKIGEALVKEKWAASASILEHTRSIYWWEGELKSGAQATLIMQCRTEHFQQVCKRLKKMHSYECPSIIGCHIDNGNPEYMDWMQRVIPTFLPQEATDGY